MTPEELSRRIKAARELRGLDQAALAEQLAAEGLGRHDLGRLERGDQRVPFSPLRRYALAKALGVPERWFTSESVDEIVGLEAPLPPPPDDGVGRTVTAEELLDELKVATRAAESLLARLGTSIGRRELESRRARDRQGRLPKRASLDT